jgi:sec-independent protein translocase protein TatC
MMRLSLWAAAFVAAPFLFYQLWAFIRPGLLPKERRLVIPFVVVTSGCFLAGSAFAYTQAFKFLGDILFQEAAAAGLRANLHASDYLDLFISTTLITGVMFELPVLFFFLARFRIVTARWMLKYWRHATMVILIFSAFFTPGDVVVTTIFFSVVLLGLYFLSVVVAWLAEPRQPK